MIVISSSDLHYMVQQLLNWQMLKQTIYAPSIVTKRNSAWGLCSQEQGEAWSSTRGFPSSTQRCFHTALTHISIQPPKRTSHKRQKVLKDKLLCPPVELQTTKTQNKSDAFKGKINARDKTLLFIQSIYYRYTYQFQFIFVKHLAKIFCQ